MVKKGLILLIVMLVTVVFAIAGCSTSSDKSVSDSGSKSQDNGDSAGGSSDSGKKVDLTFWYPWGGLDEDNFKNVVKEFEKEHPNYKVNASLVKESGIPDGKFNTAVASGNPPDLTIYNNVSYTAGMAAEGALADITEQAQLLGLSADDYFPGYTKNLEYNGKLYGLPSMGANYSVLIINKKVLRDAGIDENTIPKTFDEIEQLSEKIDHINSDGSIDKIGFSPLLKDDHVLWAGVFGAKLFSDDGKQVLFNKDPNFTKYVKWLKQHVEKYGYKNLASILNASESSDIYSSPNHPFYQGKIAFMIDGSWMGKYMLPFIDSKDLALAPLPTVNPDEPTILDLNSDVFWVPKGAKHPKEALEFVKLFTSPKYFAAYGDNVGSLSSTPAGLKEQKIATDPLFKPIFDVMDSGKPLVRPLFATEQLTQIISKAIDDILIDNTDIQKTLDKAAKDVQAELDSKVKK